MNGWIEKKQEAHQVTFAIVLLRNQHFVRSNGKLKESTDAKYTEETKINRIFEEVITRGKEEEFKNDHSSNPVTGLTSRHCGEYEIKLDSIHIFRATAMLIGLLCKLQRSASSMLERLQKDTSSKQTKFKMFPFRKKIYISHPFPQADTALARCMSMYKRKDIYKLCSWKKQGPTYPKGVYHLAGTYFGQPKSIEKSQPISHVPLLPYTIYICKKY